ncbi:MAG: radical SAM protein, partial [Planctomycetota bacterium]|nr:radical SAM protein [Planctomycetota bacterium]
TLDAAGFAPIVAARGGEPAAGEPTADKPAGPAVPGPQPASPAWPLLHRPLEAVLREMHTVGQRQLDLGGWRIGNTRWAADAEWLAGFAGRYPREIGLPIRTTLHAADVTAETADLLARAGCEEVRLPLGSASHLIRTEALGMDVTPEQVEAAVAYLREAGVRSAVRVDVGSPYETDVTLEETANLLRRIGPDRVEARLHWPEPGSLSDNVAREHGWLAPDPSAAYLAGEPAVLPPSLPAEAILEARDLLPYRVLRPGIVPLLRLARRVRIPWKGTAYAWLVEPLLAPPVRKG